MESPLARMTNPNVTCLRVNDKKLGATSPYFKQQKVMSRSTKLHSGSDRVKSSSPQHRPSTPQHRPRTVIGYEDYFDDTESSRKLKALKIKANLLEVKHTMNLNIRVPPRKCASVLGEKLENRRNYSPKCEQHFAQERFEDFNQDRKIKAFRSLVSPNGHQISRHDLSNEVSKTKLISDCIQDVGSHLKFKSVSPDYRNMDLANPSKYLNEFQRTYELDREKARMHEHDKERTRTYKLDREKARDRGKHDQYDKFCSTDDNGLNIINVYQDDKMFDEPGSKHFQEYQPSYEYDRLRCKNIQNQNQTYTVSGLTNSEQDHVNGHHTRAVDSKNINNMTQLEVTDAAPVEASVVAPIEVGNSIKRIIKRPAGDDSDRFRCKCSQDICAQTCSKCRHNKDVFGTALFKDSQKTKFAGLCNGDCQQSENSTLQTEQFNGAAHEVVQDRNFCLNCHSESRCQVENRGHPESRCQVENGGHLEGRCQVENRPATPLIVPGYTNIKTEHMMRQNNPSLFRSYSAVQTSDSGQASWRPHSADQTSDSGQAGWRPHSAVPSSDSGLAGYRPHLGIPTLDSGQAGCKPHHMELESTSSTSGVVLLSGVSLKTQVNISHINPSTLSGRITRKSDTRGLTAESDSVMPSNNECLRNKRRNDLIISSSSEISHSGCCEISHSNSSSDDVSEVHVAVSVGYDLYPLAAADGTRSPNLNHDQNVRQETESLTSKPVQYSDINNCKNYLQTNAKEFGNCEGSSESDINLLKNGQPKKHFRTESPKQTNVSFEARSLETGQKLSRQEKLVKLVKHLSNLKDSLSYYKTERELNMEGRGHTAECDDDDDDEVKGETMMAVDINISDKESDEDSVMSISDFRESTATEQVSYTQSHSSADHWRIKPEKCASITSRGMPQENLRETSPSHSLGLKSVRMLLSKVHAKQRTSGHQNSDERQPFTEPSKNANSQSKKVLVVKRPQGKPVERNMSQKLQEKQVEKNLNQFHEKNEKFIPERSRSAMEIISEKYDSTKLSSPTKIHIRRSQSSLDTKLSSAANHRHKKHLQNHEHVNVMRTPEGKLSSERNTEPLTSKVVRLHQEVEERLKSKENFVYGHRGNKLRRNDVDSEILKTTDEQMNIDKNSEIVNTPKEVNERNTIKKDDDIGNDGITHENKVVKMVFSRPSFSTSTPVKQSKMGKLNDGIFDLTKSSGTQYSRDLKVDTNNVSYPDQGTNEGRNLRNRWESQSLVTNLKKIIHKLDNTEMQPFFQESTAGLNHAHHNRHHPVPKTTSDQLHHSHDPVSKTTTHQFLGVNKKGLTVETRSDAAQKELLENVQTSTKESTVETARTHKGKNGLSSAQWMKQNGARNLGRASPAESLLIHLDDPGMVNLIQRLYRADPITRQILMVKVQFFRAWQFYTVSSREHRAKKKLLTKKSMSFCGRRLMSSHFTTWQLRAAHNYKMRQAVQMCHNHILRKGFMALKWLVSQSKHQSQTLEIIVHTILIKASFHKWKVAAETRRTLRMCTAFKQWRQHVIETQKICHMNKAVNINLLVDALHFWKKRYIKRSKTNMAFNFFRKSLLRKVISSWQVYNLWCSEKKEKHAAAVSHHQKVLVKSSFLTMLTVFSKIQKAKSHFRHHLLCGMFWAWRKGIQIYQVEKQAEMVASREHWERQTLWQSFTRWRERQKISMATKRADFNICRRAFCDWRQAMKSSTAHTEAMKSILMQKKLHRVLLVWRQNVKQVQKCHDVAVELIEHCYLQQVWRIWRMYMTARSLLKKKAQLHQFVTQHKIVVSCFSQWQKLYTTRRNDKIAKELWSQSCARRVASHWRLICYRRSLVRLLEMTEPRREQRLMKVMFAHWVRSLSQRNREKEQADSLCKNIQQRHLVNVFHMWRREAQREVYIKPLVQRQHKRILARCLEGWQDFIKQKSEYRHGQASLQTEMLRKSFNSWRKQYLACQKEKQIKKKMSQGILSCFMDEWLYLIHRKWKSESFNTLRLLQKSFYHWRNRATAALTHKALVKQEEENNLHLKREYFITWLKNVQDQVASTEQTTGQFVLRRNKKSATQAFISWRRHMQSTLVARAYQKTHAQRTLLTLFSVWHDLTSHMVNDAVLRFSEKLGLAGQLSEPHTSMEIQQNADNLRSSCCLTDSPSQRTSSFSEMPETDRTIFLSDSLQAFVEDHQAKCQRLQEAVKAVLHRLQHWPTCAAFSLWKEYVYREHQQKAAYSQLKSQHDRLQVSIYFQEWKSQFLLSRMAEKHQNKRLLLMSFRSLYIHKHDSRYKKQLSNLASRHHLLAVLHKCFPFWLRKTQSQVKEKHILHLWTSCTTQEMQLNIQEKQLAQKLDHRLLSVCFYSWLLRYQAVAKIRRVYHGHLLSWLFSTWRVWAAERLERGVKAERLLYRRRTKMVFRLWLQRLKQSRESERRYQAAWQSYLLLIFHKWKMWTKTNHKLHVLLQSFQQRQTQRMTESYFFQWKNLAKKVKDIRTNQTQKLIFKTFVSWRQTVQQMRHEKLRVFQFQIYLSSLMVKQLFRKWHTIYSQNMMLQQERQLHAKKCAHSAGVIWRRKAQVTRGHRLKVTFIKRKTACYFLHWKQCMTRIQGLYEILESRIQSTNAGIARRSLWVWRTQTRANHARKMFDFRVVYTMMIEWYCFTKASRHRQIRRLALQKTLQMRRTCVVFKYWAALARVKQSVQQNVETRLQIRVLKSWWHHTRKMHHLREQQAHFTHRVNTRILCDAFINLRCRADYCAGLHEMSDRIVRDKMTATLRSAIIMWRDRLNSILSARFYQHLLAKRGVQRWHRFVDKRKSEKCQEQEKWEKAIHCHHHCVVTKIFHALRTEVLVTKHAQKRRENLCFKFASLWKLRVDMAVTSATLEIEFVQRRVWRKWREELIKMRSQKRVNDLLDKILLRQVFSAWCNISQTQPEIKSQQASFGSQQNTSTLPSRGSPSLLPVPVARSRMSPSSSPTASATNMSFGFKRF